LAAVVKIYELTAQNSGVDKTNATVRFKLADDTTVDNSNPITIPSSGYTRSFTKQLRLYVASAPSSYINNFKVYSEGSNDLGTGVNVNWLYFCSSISSQCCCNHCYGYWNGRGHM